MRSGAQIESIFDAYGLGEQFRRPGPMASKRSKVNAALHAAELRGDLGVVLDALAATVLPDTQLQGVATSFGDTRVAEGTSGVDDDKRLFLSHAYADRSLADLLRNTLVLGGVPEDRIFYSSSRGTGIPAGEDVRGYLQHSLRASGLVVELISQTFVTRTMCLMELGGAWTLGVSTYPVVVPPFNRASAAEAVGNIHMGILDSDDDIDEVFDELHDRIAADLGLALRTASWNRAVRQFKEQLRSKLAIATVATSDAPDDAAISYEGASNHEAVAIRNVTIVGDDLLGEAANTDVTEHSATVRATFYGERGEILSTADAIVSHLRPGTAKTFKMYRIPHHFRFKVEVNTVS